MAKSSAQEFEPLGLLIDRLDNLAGALKLPMPAAFHVDELSRALPELSAELKKFFEDLTGENPWK